MATKLPRIKAGQAVTAAHLNSAIDAINRLARLDTDESLLVTTGSGGDFVSRPVSDAPMWAKLTGGGPDGRYSWREAVPINSVSPPHWRDGTRSGDAATYPAIEMTGYEGILTDGTVIVPLVPSPGGLRFVLGCATAPEPS